MQSYDQSRLGIVYETDIITGKISVSYPEQSRVTFIVSGFGRGDRVHATPGQFTKTRHVRYSGYTQKNNSPPYHNYSKTGGGFQLVPAPSYAMQTSLLYNGALSKLHDTLRGNVDLTIDIAQFGQTVRMLRAVTQLTNYIRSFSPRNWANKWLEYQYGWRPLVDTVYGAFEVTMNAGFGTRLIKGRHTIKQRSNTNRAFQSMAGVTEQFVDTDSQRCELGVAFVLRPSALQALANYGSLNPASILWELTPYSFIADWFIDIGGYLRNLETYLLYQNSVAWSYCTYTQRTTRKAFVYGKSTSGYTYYWNGSYVYSYKNRTAGGYSAPYRPRFNANLGWQRVLSAGALLKQRFA